LHVVHLVLSFLLDNRDNFNELLIILRNNKVGDAYNIKVIFEADAHFFLRRLLFINFADAYRSHDIVNIVSRQIFIFCRMLAEEIGADAKIVAEGCLLHDVGKALDHEVSGTHVEIGLEIARKFKVRPEVLHCIASHHNDVPIESPEAFIVAAADAISGARPGARRESFEAYVRRLKELEETAKSFEGVKRAFAISAGREVRVFVDTEKVDDLQQAKLAKDIAEKIEKDLTYPGVIKVNVIRERRVEETAK